MTSFEENRRDQLTTAPQSDEADAAARIDVSKGADGTVRVDVQDDASHRPGAS